MDTQTADRLTKKYPLGALAVEGKTKKIFAVTNNPALVVVVSKDDITAGDGARHDIIANKGRLSNATTCNVFRLLEACGVPVAFVEQDNVTSFVAQKCQMLPYEVVVRREAHGSYLKRVPHFSKGQLFPKLLVEFFLKTAGKRWKTHELVCDDPLMLHNEDTEIIQLFNPAEPIHGQEPFLTLPAMEVFGYAEEWMLFSKMRNIARQTFLVLEKAWQLEGGKLVDFKVEFGLDPNGDLLLADVIDNDSWRVVLAGSYIDKQVYRDGGTLDDVAAKYHYVAKATDSFQLPCQQIILWRGSESDDFAPFIDVLTNRGSDTAIVSYKEVTCSVHKEPVTAVSTLGSMVHDVPDSVVIAYVGRSNGAGPVLSAASTVPVITVPANVKEFPNDVWSSLRTPSQVPVLTVLDPANAILAALQILSARNPQIYACVRGKVEKRLVNTVQI